jgi:hypothetical protein
MGGVLEGAFIAPLQHRNNAAVPAQAGIHNSFAARQLPACAGMTE